MILKIISVLKIYKDIYGTNHTKEYIYIIAITLFGIFSMRFPKSSISTIYVIITAALQLFAMDPAGAYDWYVDARIMVVEPDYIPNSIALQIDQNAGTCSSGQFLNYYPQGSTATDKANNINAVLSSLITGLSTQRTIRIFGNNSGCVVTNLWMLR